MNKIAEILLLFVADDARRGLISFVSDVPTSPHIEGRGYQFYLKKGETSSGGVKFSGFVSPIKVDKDDRPDAVGYMTIVPYKGDKENIVWNVMLNSYDGGFDDSLSLGTGVLYKGTLAGTCNGVLFAPDEEEAPRSPTVTAAKGAKRKTADVPY